ncbi:MAG: hypothetical protein ACN6PI_13220 [Sphingobacterium siyangense]
MKRSLLGALIALSLVSCSKNDTPEQKESKCLLTEISNSGDPSKTTIEYDKNGKITAVTKTYGGTDPATHRYIYTYSNNSINVEDIWNGKPSDVFIYTLSNGRIIKKSGGRYEDTFTYDSNSFLSTIKSQDRSVLIQYENGNISKMEVNFYSSVQQFIPEYNTHESRIPFAETVSYTFDGFGPTGTLEDAILFEQGYFGSQGKSEIVSVKQSYGESSPITTFNYSYIKDNNGKVTSIKKGSSMATYSYQCSN